MTDAPNLIFTLVATSAAVAVGGLTLLQTDVVSRKILDPAQLNTKRRGEYMYSWKQALDRAKLQMDFCLAGGSQNYNCDPEIVTKNTEYVSKEEDLTALVQKIVDKKSAKSKFFALKIDKDPHDPAEEIFLFIVHEERSSNHRMMFQVPLVEFGMKLAQAFEDQLTTTTLCFVADASAGKATSMLESLVKESNSGVAVVSEPFWMVQIARLAETSILTLTKLRKLVFALCRLDAWSVRQEVGDAKTVMFTLPGQAVVATLLPLVQSAFPEDRHIFAYDGCVASVKRGVYAERTHETGEVLTKLDLITRGICNNPVRICTPLPSKSPLSHDVSLGGSGGSLERSFAQVPLQHARIVEAWISSVDAYFKLKDKESTNGYLPYCLKLGLLADNPVGNFEYGTDSYWSLNSCLQYVTGCQGRALSETVINAAKVWIKNYNLAQAQEQAKIEKLVSLSEHDRTMIENCCFQHKQILIGNKTLQDTVLPKEHWTIKQASRNGCSCCGPDPYDQMEEEENGFDSGEVMTDDFGMGTINTANGVNGSLKNYKAASSNGYVDATQVFAFDPSRFS